MKKMLVVRMAGTAEHKSGERKALADHALRICCASVYYDETFFNLVNTDRCLE